MHKLSLRTAVVFSFFVFLIVTATAILTVLISAAMFHFGLLSFESRGYAMLVPMLASTLVGTALSVSSGKRVIRVVEDANDAIGQVAKGNFDVKMNENIPVLELKEIARNFNAMTRELAGTEMLRNDFVENVSHEFKTPLTAIEGYATLLQQKNLPEEKRVDYTQKILRSTRRLNTLTGNILLLSRLENQELEIRREAYSLDEQIRETILLLEPGWSAKEIELDIDLEDCEYTGGRELMGQVWQNILGNAVKFTQNGGRIRVHLSQNGGGVTVRISDNGPGMTEEVKNRIFEKFYQGDTTRSTQGNGLGLALAKRILDLHGGSITVDSQPNAGTSFTITLQ